MASRFLVATDDPKFASWVRYSLESAWPQREIKVLDMAQLRRARASITVRDYDVALIGLTFGETPEDTEADGLDWLRKLKSQPAFPEIVVLAEGGSELTAVRAIRVGALDYLPKRLLTPFRMQNAVRIALRAVERAAIERVQRRESQAAPAAAPAATARPHHVTTVTSMSGIVPTDLIPGFRILQRLGDSDAASVYLAMSDSLGKKIALKVAKRICDEAQAGDAAERAMFDREFSALRTLSHPAIVQIYDYGKHEGREYLAMEYFPCGDLKARLQHPISQAEALAFVREIAAALRAVHTAGIVHRDLKPPNVMLREDGSVVLIDFGLARSLVSGESSTRTGVLRGSPYYMSPEQAQGDALDARTDLYSLGVILYEMLVGKKPHLGASAMDVLRQHVSAPVPTLPVECARWQWLLEGLMAKQREQRFSSAEAVLDAMDGARVGESTIARASVLAPDAPLATKALPAADHAAAAAGGDAATPTLAADPKADAGQALDFVLGEDPGMDDGPSLKNHGAASPQTGGKTPDEPPSVTRDPIPATGS
jgi:DNA-binding response OmpR family regulator